MTPHTTGYWIGVLFGAAMMGGLCGLMPLLTGMNRSNITLGGIGFVCTLIAGLILGVILALPVAVVFTIIILATNRSTPMR